MCPCRSRCFRQPAARRSSAPAMAATRCTEMRRRSSLNRAGHTKSTQRGFTMIEVLVALAIIAVALSASLRAVGSLASGEADLHRRLLAGWSADNTLAQLRLTHAWPNVGETSFECSQGNLQLICTEH